MLTVPQAARRLRKNPETVRRWIREGKLRARKIGTQHVIEDHDLRAALADSAAELPVPPAWRRMADGRRVPNSVEAIRRTREGR